MLVKKQAMTRVYHGDAPPPSEARLYSMKEFEFEDYPILKEFGGCHPAVMQARVAASSRRALRRNRWLQPAFYRAVLKKGFRG